jgi:hypothetical protein
MLKTRSGAKLPQTNPRKSPIFTRSRLGVTSTEAVNSTRAHACKGSYTAGSQCDHEEAH